MPYVLFNCGVLVEKITRSYFGVDIGSLNSSGYRLRFARNAACASVPAYLFMLVELQPTHRVLFEGTL